MTRLEELTETYLDLVDDIIAATREEERERIGWNADLAHKLSKIVHDSCSSVPHDIGLRLMEAVRKAIHGEGGDDDAQ